MHRSLVPQHPGRWARANAGHANYEDGADLVALLDASGRIRSTSAARDVDLDLGANPGEGLLGLLLGPRWAAEGRPPREAPGHEVMVSAGRSAAFPP
jgi:hypothetical protein